LFGGATATFYNLDLMFIFITSIKLLSILALLYFLTELYELKNLKKVTKKIIDGLHQQKTQLSILFFVAFIILITATIEIMPQLSSDEQVTLGEIIIIIVIGSVFIYGWATNHFKRKTQKKLTEFSFNFIS